MNSPKHISDFFSAELSERIKKNNNYSMRAFARDLEISPTTLSNILNKKVGISEKQADHILTKLNFPLEESKLFRILAEKDFSKTREKRNDAEMQLYRFETRYNTLTDDVFVLIKEWYHLAIMELTRTSDFQEKTSWIAAKLNISEKDVDAALERLLKLEILERIDGKLQPTKDYFIVLSEAPSEAVKYFQISILKKLIESFDTQPRHSRDIGSSILRVRKGQLDEIKKDIKNFRRDLSLKIESGENHDSVYCLSTAFFQLDS